jgi:hypothetical protein|tara:strand:- start:284 stop:451 length:168 start_codon:yes stop_codon:yes gene_type:complete
MNNWWSELEIMKRNVAEQQEQLQLAYIKIKELSDIFNKERKERELLGLTCPHCGK